MVNAASLQEENARLKAQLEEKERLLQSRERRIVTLEELIKQFNRKQYSASSEKLSKDQLDLGLFNEAESTQADDGESASEETVEVPAHTRRKKPRVSIPAHIPREEVLYELPEPERVCPHDGTELKAIGTEDHEQLDIIPAQAKVILHRRQKYICPFCEQYHVTATKPKQPIETCGSWVASRTNPPCCSTTPTLGVSQSRWSCSMPAWAPSWWMVTRATEKPASSTRSPAWAVGPMPGAS